MTVYSDYRDLTGKTTANRQPLLTDESSVNADFLQGENGAFYLAWANLTGVPSTFPPSSHTHTPAQVGLGNVNNTSDAAKPISTATQTALNLKANSASPTFTGTVTAPQFSGGGASLTGVNAATLGGDANAAFAKLSGAVFTGGVTATGFTGNGGAITGVDAANLGGKSPGSYALLAGATFTGAVAAPSFSGDLSGNGSGVTSVNAATLGGSAKAAFALLTGASFSGGVGIGGASADATNKLSVNGAGALFNNAGSDIRITLNKDATSDTAAFIFQKGFSTRAEFGLTGNDKFSFKVSADGSAFNTSFEINQTTAETKFLKPVELPQYSRAALPSSAASGRIIYVYDATGGATVAFCDGGGWKSFITGNAV